MSVVAVVLPSSHMFSHCLHVGDTPVEALPREDAQFDFCDIEPTAVLGGVVDLKPFSKPASLFGWKRFIQGCDGMDVEVVHDEPYAQCIRIAFVEHTFNPPCPIHSGPVLGYLDVSPARQGFDFEKDLCDAVADVFVVYSLKVFPAHRRSARVLHR